MNDATILIRDMAGDAAQNAANRVNPSQDQLSQIDHPAEDNTWHEVPDLSPANLKGQAQARFNKNKPLNKGDLQDAAGDATESANPAGTRDPNDAVDYGSGVDAQGGAMTGAQNLKDKASANISQDTKDQARERANNVKASTKNYLGSKMPKERREQTIWRLKKMIVEIQGHSDCKSPNPTRDEFALTWETQTNKPSRLSSTWPRLTEVTARTFRNKVPEP